jgi:Holliday junction resolvase
MSRESNIVGNIRRYLKTVGGKSIKMHGSQFSEAGTPDILWIHNGHAFWFEVKRPGEDPTKIQLHRIAEWTAAGASVAVVRSVAEARAIVEHTD